MKQQNQLIRVEEFHLHTLRQAFEQGRLYILQPATCDIREESIRSILQYVSRIDACASRQYLTTIGQLWQELLRSPQLGDLFFLRRYSTTRGQPNWYRVNAVVLALLEHGIYCQGRYTAVELHLLMEQSTRRNSHYTSMNCYLLERHHMKILLQYTERLRIPD